MPRLLLKNMKCLIPILLMAVTGFAQTATYLTGQSARLVIGQPEFDSESDTATSSIVGAAAGVAWANNMLFVADANMVSAAPINNRVLIYTNVSGQLPSTTAPLAYTSQCPICVGVANVVLGQPDFVTTTPIPCITPPPNISTTTTPTSPVCPANASQTPLANGMRNPSAVASDGTHLAVADTNNNRVLIWNSIPTAMNQPPDVVVGQTNFTSAVVPGQTPTATSLRNPQGVWLQGGKLFVADTQNDRVLIYNSIPTSNGAAADIVLGQPNMTTYVQINIAEQSTSAANNNLLTPVSVTSDGTRLFVADLGYNRVLIWNTIPTANQQPADVEVGQPNMAGSLPNNAFTCSISGTCPATATGQGVETALLCTVSNGVDFNNNPTYPTLCGSTLSFPRFALSDGTRLYIADGGNDRVLVFNTIPTVNGVAPDVILGQTSDTSDEATDGSDSLNTPMGLAWDGTNLYIADCYNQRIVVYTPNGENLPYSAVRNAASINIYAVGTVTIGGTIKAGDKVTVTIGVSTSTTTASYPYTIQSGDNAAAIVNGLVALINAGASGDPNGLATADVAADEVVLTAKTPGADGDNVTLAASISTNATVTAVTSGANLNGGGDAASIAPGSIVEIMGTNLSDNVTMSAPAGALNLPTSLGGVQVSFNGVPAPLLYVSPTQINAQVPFQFEFTSGTVNAWVRTQNPDNSVTVTNTVGVSIVPANPGIFAQPGNDPRVAIAMHSSNYASALISVDGVVHGGDVGTICIGSTATLTPVSVAPATGCTGQTYNYTVQETDTLATVVSAYLILMANDPQVTVQAAGEFTRIVVYARNPGSAGNGIPINVAVSTGARLLLTAVGPAVPSPGTGVLTCCASTAGAMVTPTSQAVPGETIIVYATGLGLPVLTPPVAPYLVTGQKYQGPANNTPGQSVSALVNSLTANVIEAALIPGTVGLYQVSLQLNSSIATDPFAQLTIAQNDFVSNVVTIPIQVVPLLSSLTCSTASLNSDSSTTCTVLLSVAAPSGGVTVLLSSSSTLLEVPASVSIAAAATSVTFTAATGTIPSSQSATITATLNSSTANLTFTLSP